VTEAFTAPYINFQGRAREAFELYHRVLGGDLFLFGFDASGQINTAESGPVGFGRLVAGQVRILGSDGNPDYPGTRGDTVAINLTGSDRAALSKAFDELAEGGTVQMPLTEAPWGTAGWLKDRFGIIWNVDVTR
jgi:PhnB protein